MNKKAYLKTLEAILAFIITFAFIIVVSSQYSATKVSEERISVLPLLEQRDDFRNCVAGRNETCVYSQIRPLLQMSYAFNISISSDPSYVPDLPANNIHSESIFVSGNSTKYAYAIVRLYYWRN